jgi:hypothetical protein
MKKIFLVLSASVLLMATGCSTNTGITKNKSSILDYNKNGQDIEIRLKTQPYSDRSFRAALLR